jgi:hypothetical protein
MIAWLYRYPHPTLPDVWVYCGQECREGKRHTEHKRGKTPFSQAWQNLFPNTPLPEPVREQVEAESQQHLNVMESNWFFQYKTWAKDYSWGMNHTIPTQNYRETGRLAVESPAFKDFQARYIGSPKHMAQLAALNASPEHIAQLAALNASSFYQAKRRKQLALYNASSPNREHLAKLNVSPEHKAHLARLHQGAARANLVRGGHVTMHNRWHRNRNIVSPFCDLCRELYVWENQLFVT